MSSSAKRKPPARPASRQDEVNKKALIWLGVAFGVIVVVLGVLIALDV